MYLLTNQKSDGSSEGYEVVLKSYTEFVFVCDGTFDGCTVKIQIQGKDNWVDCGSDAEFTQGGACKIDLRGGMNIRGTVVDAGASTDVSLQIIE